jgi:deazaflavin-dependent oxidoreductase (nitroreductase family)
MTTLRQIANELIAPLIRAGVAPKHNYLLTTIGRKSKKSRTNPVMIVEEGSRRWLVAPYGAVPWVLNARASGSVTLTRRSESRDYTIREVSAPEAGRVLKRYVKLAPIVLPYFEAGKDAPVGEFEREAHLHPVFELTPR